MARDVFQRSTATHTGADRLVINFLEFPRVPWTARIKLGRRRLNRAWRLDKTLYNCRCFNQRRKTFQLATPPRTTKLASDRQIHAPSSIIHNNLRRHCPRSENFYLVRTCSSHVSWGSEVQISVSNSSKPKALGVHRGDFLFAVFRVNERDRSAG